MRFRSTIEIKKYLAQNPDVKCDLSVTHASRPKGFKEISTNQDQGITIARSIFQMYQQTSSFVIYFLPLFQNFVIEKDLGVLWCQTK